MEQICSICGEPCDKDLMQNSICFTCLDKMDNDICCTEESSILPEDIREMENHYSTGDMINFSGNDDG